MNNFYELKEIVGEDNDTDKYVVVAEYPEIDYAIIYRNSRYEPWVAAWGYDKEHGYWSQGHYFASLESAVEWIQIKKGKIARSRLEEIASTAIDHIIETDPDDAEEWIDEVELDTEERKYFCTESNIAEANELVW